MLKQMPFIIITFIFLSIKDVYSFEEYFLTLRNEQVNLRQGPSFNYPIKLL